MPIANLINRECWITRRSDSGSVDEYGDADATETVVETVCEIQQKTRDEEGDQGQLSDTLWDGFFLPTEELGSGDSVSTADGTYEVVGAPERKRNPRTQTYSHIQASLRRTAGPEDGS